jgi:hypothetical protein
MFEDTLKIPKGEFDGCGVRIVEKNIVELSAHITQTKVPRLVQVCTECFCSCHEPARSRGLDSLENRSLIFSTVGEFGIGIPSERA